MKQILLITVAIGLAAVPGCGENAGGPGNQATREPEPKSEEERFEGVWKLVSHDGDDANARTMFQALGKTPTLVIREKLVLAVEEGTGKVRFLGLSVSNVDPTTSPRSLSWNSMFEGVHGGASKEAIYRMDGGRLTIAYGSKFPYKRPADFSAGPGSYVLGLELQSRKKDERVEKFFQQIQGKPGAVSPEDKKKVVTAKPAVTIEGPKGRLDVVFSPDAKAFATARNEPAYGSDRKPGDVRLWETATGRELRKFSGPRSSVAALRFSPDGRRLAAACSEEKAIHVWEASSGRELLVLEGHQDWLTSLAFSRDGTQIVSGGGDVRVWDAAGGKLLQTLKGPGGPGNQVARVAFSPDRRYVLAASFTGNFLKVWDAKSGSELQALRANQAAFTPDGKGLAVNDGTAQYPVLDVATGKQLRTVPREKGASLFLEPGMRRLVSYPAAGQGMQVRDAVTGAHLYTVDPSAIAPALGNTKLVFSPDGRWLALATGDYHVPSAVRIWETAMLEAQAR